MREALKAFRDRVVGELGGRVDAIVIYGSVVRVGWRR
jgi:predicted nucleotidyltransferase